MGARTRRRRRFYRRFTWRRGNPHRGTVAPRPAHACTGQNGGRNAGPTVVRSGSVYGSNTWRARTSRVMECSRPREGTASGRRERAQTPRRRASRAGARAASRSAFLCRTGNVWPRLTQHFATKVYQVMNRKVVDLTTLYHLHKGRMVFFSTDFAQITVKL
jgi:hypothetical protein